jgi:hypothetical protein
MGGGGVETELRFGDTVTDEPRKSFRWMLAADKRPIDGCQLYRVLPLAATCTGRFRLGVSHLLLLFTTATCTGNFSRVVTSGVCNSVLQKFTVKKKQDGEMHRCKIAVYFT